VTAGGRITLVPTPQKTFPRKVVESVVVVCAGAALMALGTFGSFTNPATPFPAPSVTDSR
jgi:hypothetical protein